MSKLEKSPYKGVRDFYPEDMRFRKWLFGKWREVAEKYGYVEYDASILEPADLYRAKTGDEIVNEQTYTFIDRGDREVTLRPEMTPTLARMVAQKRRDLGFPLRWYSIPNLFRYEAPQRGRLREHWQFNADLFGSSQIEADAEAILIAYDIMKNLGANDSHFEIRISNSSGKKDERVEEVIKVLAEKGISNTRFDDTLVRGQSYYTGVVFEVFDTDKVNHRSIMGGGRYDNLLDIFGEEKIPAVGFAMGDVTARDFLQTHGLLPNLKSETNLAVFSFGDVDVSKVADELRGEGLNVFVDYTDKDIADKKRNAGKNGIPFYIVVGENEIKSGKYTLKSINGDEKDFSGTLSGIIEKLRQ